MSITEHDLLEALRDAMVKGPETDGFTTRELAASLGMSLKNMVPVRNAIRTLIADGKLEAVSVSRMQISGVASRTCGYRLKP